MTVILKIPYKTILEISETFIRSPKFQNNLNVVDDLSFNIRLLNANNVEIVLTKVLEKNEDPLSSVKSSTDEIDIIKVAYIGKNISPTQIKIINGFITGFSLNEFNIYLHCERDNENNPFIIQYKNAELLKLELGAIYSTGDGFNKNELEIEL